jgi:hypothetical protein
MFGFPEYFADEYMYASRAWWFAPFNLTDYAQMDNIYDHPPLGWILMGIFGYIFSFGFWIERARYFIAICFFINQILLYLIACKYFNQKIGIIALILFSFQTGLIEYQRMVFLENIGIVFLLLAFFFMKNSDEKKDENENNYKLNPRTFYQLNKLSGFFIGCAILTKYTFIFFIPAFLIVYLLEITQIKNQFESNHFFWHILWDLFKWTFVLLIPILSFFIFTLFLAEFYISDAPSVISLILWHSSRTDLYPFWNSKSEFIQSISYYYFTMRFFLITTLVSVILIIILFLVICCLSFFSNHKNKRSLFNNLLLKFFPLTNYHFRVLSLCFFIFFYFLFLVRGGVVSIFYFLPIFPFSVLIMSFLLFELNNFIKKIIAPRLSIILNSKKKVLIYINLTTKLIQIILILLMILPFSNNIFYEKKNTHHQLAYQWILQNISPEKTIVAFGLGAYQMPELYMMGYLHYYVSYSIFQTEFRFNSTLVITSFENIDYLICNNAGRNIISESGYQDSLLFQIFNNSRLIVSFPNSTNEPDIFIYLVSKT